MDKRNIIDAETGIWNIELAEKRHRYDPNLAEGIVKIFKSVRSVADLGCGLGHYCKFLKEQGIPLVHGYEGTQNIQKIAAYDDVMVLDLTKKRWVEISYNLVICIEVGEHIPKKYEQIFIDNVCEFTKKFLILSWAIPGQGGRGHFNEQPNEYVISKFVEKGLRLERKKTKFLREASGLKWLANTIMVFRK